MSTRDLYGMSYSGYEISLPCGHEPKELTKPLRKILEKHLHLHSVTLSPDPDDENSYIYTVVVAD
jgi:hypothetical protein